MKRAIQKNFKQFMAIIVLAVLAAGIGVYILANERLRFPVFEPTPKKMKFEFSTAQAVTPGQGQTVRVSGIRIGDISKAELKDGRAVVTANIEPKYFKLIHTNASALLRPKTPLKDMFIELNPGTKSAPRIPQNFTVTIGNTLPDVNTDEILASLDRDTRDYIRTLITDAGRGLHGRGADLRDVFRRLGPTHRDLSLLNSQLAERQDNLRHVIHSLHLINAALDAKHSQLVSLVRSSSDVFRAFASEQASVTAAVHRLPGTLRQTTSTLGSVHGLANALRPAADHLRPALRELTVANREVQPFAREAAPILRTQIRPFVRRARPLVRSLSTAAVGLGKASPSLNSSFVVLNHLFNMLGFNPNGREAPGPQSRQEGFLFWLAWLNHDATSVFSTSDANGPLRALTLGARCTTFKQMADSFPPLGMLLAPTLFDPNICGTSP
jgi:phospholipid/cholesterol/gamma-HCH transport system substrate-binding protein